ncbi:uncharacterized protein PV06_00313 [Exophiala oligosperma]|uniref:Selenoprotein W-like protein n=1 Tax=Exophiala oligosperma TaxID=215243 RepID=A0A0D2EI49_9EURO|nr:uncharacterized protein PV06_00313 [Exophiala oligosperma]KIW47634.1 hypothetical protein PV06_00313 [Exophiala oligosperma]
MTTQAQAAASSTAVTSQQATTAVQVPRISIKFCTQCKWNLRAAYYAQELLQTFGTSVGEIALVPATGGIFTVTMTHAVATSTSTDSKVTQKSEESPEQMEPTTTTMTTTTVTATDTILWDRKTDGGFPETKELKSRVRNIIQPGRDLGHIDRSLNKAKTTPQQQASQAEETVRDGSSNGSNQETGGGEGEAKSKIECEDCK